MERYQLRQILFVFDHEDGFHKQQPLLKDFPRVYAGEVTRELQMDKDV